MTPKIAEKMMTSRMHASEASHQTIVGESDLRDLAPGAKVTPFDLANPQYAYETAIIMSIEHEAVNQSYETADDTAPYYLNRFTALPANLPATPHRTVPRPRIDGTMIGIIAGPEGEEIYCTRYGEVYVWWPWDRRARKDGTDTKPIRVVQSWAGAGWGSQFIPRIGMEAIVSFEDGDPDRPIIIGLCHNANNLPPYQLPKHKTYMTIKSKTHKGKGSSEFRIEDEQGLEQVYVHGEKDLDIIIERDRREWIKNDRHLIAGGKRVEEIKGGVTSTTAADRFEGTAGKHTVAVGSDHAVNIGKKYSVAAGETIYLRADAAIVIEAPEVTLKSPGGFVKLGPGGLTMMGKVTNINSGGEPGTGVPASATTALKVERADDRSSG